MIYSPSVLVPHNTLQSSPVVKRVSITEGLLFHVEVFFPPGCSGLVSVQIFDGAHQCFPSNEGEYFFGDNINISLDDLYPKESSPDELQIKAWSSDDAFDHTVAVRLSILPDDAFRMRFSPSSTSDELRAIIALLEEQQNKTPSQKSLDFLAEFG